MNKSELIKAIAEGAELSNAAAGRALDAFTKAVEQGLRDGERIALTDFGIFETRQRAARSGRNPQSGETIQIAAATTVGFKPAKKLKQALNQ